MRKGTWISAKEVLKVNAAKWPDKIGIKDLYKAYTFARWNERACRLANALAGMGLKKGDRFAVLGYNCVEWMEIYAAAAKGGFVCVPLMFRLAAPEMEYIINHCEAKVLIVQGGLDGQTNKPFPWIDMAGSMKERIPCVEQYVSFALGSETYEGFAPYEELIARANNEEPFTSVSPDDPWVIMYTGGTTGTPKGVVKSHANVSMEYFIQVYEHRVDSNEVILIVMPCCHINSLYYSFTVTWTGGTVVLYNMVSFVPEDLLRVFSEQKITFTSLVPTHYIMLLALPGEIKKKYDLTHIKKLLISSAPARRDTKLGILEMFPNSSLYEAYGSTEAGIVTVLQPEDQLTKLGSCGREVIGSDLLRLYDPEGRLITEPNKVGEVYSKSAMIFEAYWKDPEKTATAMKGDYFSAGDMGYKDEEGYLYLVDRKANMIISGGENIFPSEVEDAVGSHPKVKDVAVIGVPHEKWGEQVMAVVVPHDGQTVTAEEIITHCKGKIAGYKVPKTITFIRDDEMPRSGAHKILHRVLRERYGMWKDHN